MKTRVMVLLIRLALAYLFLRSGVPKVAYPLIFADAVQAYELLPSALVPSVIVVVPWLEIVAALALLVGLLTEGAALLTGLLSLSFAVLVTSALWRGLDISCGCFTTDISVIQWRHVVFDLVLLAMSFLVHQKGPGVLALDNLFRRRSTPSADQEP